MDNNGFSNIKRIMQEMVDTGYTNGILCMIMKDGKEIFCHETGYRDEAQKIAFTRDTLCSLYSLTKVVTSTAAMILIEKGIIKADDPLSKYLPEYESMKVQQPDGSVSECKIPILISNLLNMTSGLPYPGDEVSESEKASGRIHKYVISKMKTPEAVCTRELARMYADIPLSFEPGQKWEYGMSADILGAVIEVASGKRFSDFLRENIFEPLGMNDTGFFVSGNKTGRLSEKFIDTPSGLKKYDGLRLCVDPNADSEPSFESGGAGLISTADDYMKLMTMLLNKGVYGNTRILSEQTVGFMTGPGLDDRQKEYLHLWEFLTGHSYGNFLRILEEPGEAKSKGRTGEYGWDSWTGCYAANIPDEKMTILIMQQRVETGTTRYICRIRDEIFS